ncbi:hypothetical protein ACSQ67_018516 [Phaseolus vulgaris]
MEEREQGEKMSMLIFKSLLISLLLVFSSRHTVAEKKINHHSKSTYIIYTDKFSMPSSFNDHLLWYDSSLKSVSDSAERLYTYQHVAHGFSTRLTTQEAELLSKQPGILSVIPEIRYDLHTTRTPEFLGLEKFITLSLASGRQSDVVVGVLDTGVWPELKSFDDKGLGPVPSSWKEGSLCSKGSLIAAKVAGKIVICDRGGNARVEKGLVVKSAGGSGMILANSEDYGEELVADSYLLPAIALGQKSSNVLKKYVFSSPNPTAKLSFGGTHLGVQPSPVVAAFSSRGPNLLTPKVLKPDLIAPGVNILAGWTGAVGPTGMTEDTRHVEFNIISGTSMSCPHVSGLAALLKGTHPEWSPAAIRSALMTTSYRTYKNGQTLKDVYTGLPATPFDFGAGHVDPVTAFDPGLVYDATVDDYLSFFCALNYSSYQIKLVARRDFTCSKRKKYRVEDLNYPSFAVPFNTAFGVKGGSQKPTAVQYKRTLTNVGAPATYKVSVTQSPSVKIVVEPQTLSFRQLNEKKSYTVTFTSSSKPSGTNSFAYLEWSDGKHKVSSPIAFSWT